MLHANDKLREMPYLAEEALLTYNAPSRSSASGGRKAANDAPPAPTDLNVLDALNPKNHLAKLQSIAAGVWEVLEEENPLLPELLVVPANPRSWSEVCGFLLSTYDLWYGEYSEDFNDYVDKTINQAYADLKQAARAVEPEKLICTVEGCNAEILSIRDIKDNLRTADTCLAGHSVMVEEFARRIINSEELPLKDIAKRLSFPQSTLYRWAKDGELKPTSREGSKKFYRVGDVADLIDIKRA